MKLENFDFSKKIFYHPEKILDYKNGKRPFPVTVEIDLTNNCNHKCSFCFYADKIGRGNMPTLDTKKIKKTITEMKEMGTKGISFTGGGEPLLHPDFLEIQEHAKSTGLDLGLITNGSAINKKKVRSLCENFTWVRISMAGGDNMSYQKVQGVDQFQKVLDNLKLLYDEKKLINSKLNIGVRILVTTENINSLLNFADTIKNIEINYLQISPDQYTKDKGEFWYSEASQNIFKKLEKKLKKFNIKLLTSNYVWGQDQLDIAQKCYAHFFQLALCAEGDLMFCKNARGEKKFIIGNIYKTSLKEIWNSDLNKKLESWVKPNNCGLYCKHIHMNNSLEKIINPTLDDSANFVG
jgi:GTP 3',8-cyclase